VTKAWSRVKACQAWHPNLAKETWPILIFTDYYQCQCVLEGTECTAAWCSVDNWQPLTCGVYFYGELKASNEERRDVLFEASLTT